MPVQVGQMWCGAPGGGGGGCVSLETHSMQITETRLALGYGLRTRPALRVLARRACETHLRVLRAASVLTCASCSSLAGHTSVDSVTDGSVAHLISPHHISGQPTSIPERFDKRMGCNTKLPSIERARLCWSGATAQPRHPLRALPTAAFQVP
jgi:hypothetical protein